jgi:hypothetical protein
VLDHHRRNGPIRQHTSQFAAFTIHPRPDLCDNLVHRQAVVCRPPRQPRHLAVQINTLVMRRHPGVEHRPGLPAHRRPFQVHQNQTPDPPYRHRQIPLPPPPVSSVLIHTHPIRPLRKIHKDSHPHTRYFASSRGPLTALYGVFILFN